MVPLCDAILRLDFLAQKLVPYASSSFIRCSNVAMMEPPSWNRPSPQFPGAPSSQPDLVAAERHRLIQLVCTHNKLSRVVWGSWYPTSEQPSHEESTGFYNELLLWKANSPATFARSADFDSLEALDPTAAATFAIPPPALILPSSDIALNIGMYNGFLGCVMATIIAGDGDNAWEGELYKAVYQNLCIAAGLMEKRDPSVMHYSPCDGISTGISSFLFHAVRRCFSDAWRKWTTASLRSIGREGLSNGFTLANTLEIMFQVEARIGFGVADGDNTPLPPLSERLIPLLLPRPDDGQYLAYFLLRDQVEGNKGSNRIVTIGTRMSKIPSLS